MILYSHGNLRFNFTSSKEGGGVQHVFKTLVYHVCFVLLRGERERDCACIYVCAEYDLFMYALPLMYSVSFKL
jgi:hypothetical protein